MFDTTTPITGNGLRRLRKAAGFTQRELAARLGVHANYLAQLERGEVAVREVVGLAAIHICRCPMPKKGGRKHDR